jgi:hypothetical protein
MTTPWFTVSGSSVALFFCVFSVAFGALLVALRRAAKLPWTGLGTVGLWLVGYAGLVLVLAWAEVFLSLSLPPRPLLAAFVGFVVLILATRRRDVSTAIEMLPMGYLVLLQGFRLPLELVMHRLAAEKVMPVVMSYSGRNFDVVSGALAFVVGFGILRLNWPVWTAWVFGAVGTGLLLNVVTVAVRTMPGVPFGLPSDLPNIWVAYPPFVLLPAMLVPLAAWLHYRLFRALLGRASAQAAARAGTSIG